MDRAEIVETLLPLNGGFFQIQDLEAYAEKVLRLGRVLEAREPGTGRLRSYLLYYDDRDEAYISMVWTSPQDQRQGLAAALLARLLAATAKPIALEVDLRNPARRMYEAAGFLDVRQEGRRCLMRRPAAP